MVIFGGVNQAGKKSHSQRKYRWFVVNHLMLIGLLTSLAFYVFVVPPADVADRASVTFTLVLTVTAAKLVVADSLPKLPFLTVLDKYMIACFILLFMVVLANILVALFIELNVDVNTRRLDLVLAGVLFTVWAVYNLRLAWRVMRRLRRIRQCYGARLHPLPFDLEPALVACNADEAIGEDL